VVVGNAGAPGVVGSRSPSSWLFFLNQITARDWAGTGGWSGRCVEFSDSVENGGEQPIVAGWQPKVEAAGVMDHPGGHGEQFVAQRAARARSLSSIPVRTRVLTEGRCLSASAER
jgi:hypothetical protein